MEFKDQGVVEVKQMKKTVGGLLTPLPTYVLTFDLVKLPSVIRAAWLRLEVRPYIPTCRRCFHCQRFGHVINSCRKRMQGEKGVCAQCGQGEHGECTNSPHCINCGEDHPASSKKCSRFIFEQEVQTLRAKEHLSFKEARQRVSSMLIKPGTMFSSLFSKTSSSNIKNPAAGLEPQVNNRSKSQASNNTMSQNTTRTRSSNARRRLSGEREENPSSKAHLSSNSFDILHDEMDSETINSVSTLPMDRVGSSVSTCSVEQVESPVLVCAHPQAETPLSACNANQAGGSFSACSLEQVENVNLDYRNQAKSPGTLRPNASPSVSSLERADSFVSASSGQEELLPTLENKPITSEKVKVTGTIAKSTPNISEQGKNPQNPNRKLKVTNKVSQVHDNKGKDKNVIVIRKTKGASKTSR